MRRYIWISAALFVIGCLVIVAASLTNADRWRSSCTGPFERGSAPADAGVADTIRQRLPPFAEGTSVAIDVVDLEACAEIASLDADSGFPTASVVKLLIALDAVERSDDAATDEIERMLSASDDSVASSLWMANGGPEIVRRMAAKLELDATRPPRRAGQWGDTQMSAHDVARVYQYLAAEADKDTRGLVLEALAAAPDSAADGFPQHFGIPDGLPNHPWAIKQGWGSTTSNTVLHSTGLVRGDRDLVVVVLSTWPAGTDWDMARSAMTTAISSLGSTM